MCDMMNQCTNKKRENLSLTLSVSKHAVLRMAQRNVSLDDLKYVLDHGKRINRTGIAVFMLRKRDIPSVDRNKSKISRLEGTVVLTEITQNGQLGIITTYRNRSAFKVLRCKAKYDARKRYQANHHLHRGE
jgi:uncharacterized protein DUF4258